VTVNSLGFRGPEISPTPDSQTIRVAVLGGSSVFGYLVPQGQDSCAQLESLLKAAGVESEVINAGVPGFNMTQVRHRYNDAIVPLRPDYVILYLGWNNTPFLISDTPTSLDTSPPAPPLLQRMLVKSALYGLLRYRLFPPNNPRFAPPSSASTKVTEAGAREFQRELDRLIDAITTSGAAPIISTQISASAVDCKHLNQFLGSTPQQIEANRKIGNWISTTMRNTASDRDIELVDCAKLANCEQELLGDTIHLTKLGHEVVAKAWATAILGKIEAVDR
jgi:lysophospholipase L1-like esterase